MAGSASEFGRLLNEAIQRVKSREDKLISVILDELGYEIDRTAATIESWRKGNLPARQGQIEKLTQALAKRTDLDRAWFKRFLSVASYLNLEPLLDEIRPAAADAPTAPVIPTPAAENSPSGAWLLIPPERIPEQPTVVGRQKELLYLTDKLTHSHCAVITGMPGIGKTTIAAALIRQMGWQEERVFWHTFRGNEGLDDIVWRLTNFLAWHGNDYFLRLLQSKSSPPAAMLFDAVLHTMHGKNYLLCFDDLHLLDEAVFSAQMLKPLQPRVNSGGVAVLIVSRTVPQALSATKFAPLQGLERMDTQNLLSQHGFTLSADLVTTLHALTQGNPQLLTLAMSTLRDGGDLEKLILRILKTIDIENYLLAEVDANLSNEAREVMKAVSILLNYAGTQAAIEAIAKRGNLVKSLNQLCSQNLLLQSDKVAERQYSLHSSVQSFYYNLIDDSERQNMHQRAAIYYEISEGDWLKAALHFEKADSYERAIQLMVGEKGAQLINKGNADSVIRLLERLINKHGTALEKSTLWLPLCETRGKIYRVRGVFRQTIHLFETILPKTQSPEEKARILYELGMTYDAWGKYEEAKNHHQQSLELYRSVADVTGVAKAHSGIGWACYERNQFALAREHFEISLQMATQVQYDDYVGRAEIGLGLTAWRENKLAEAQQWFERSQQRMHQLGEVWSEAAAISNLGLIQDELGEHEKARSLWEQAVEIFDRTGRIDNLLITYCNLGESYYQTGEYKTAITYHEETVNLAQNTENTLLLSYGYARLAETRLATGDKTGALQFARQALQIAQQHNHRAELGISYRILGDIWLAHTDFAQAQSCFEESLPILQETSQHKDLTKAQLSYQKLLSERAAN